MIEFFFTLDYEIYGNGEGSLRKLIYEPAKKLKTIFNKCNARLVIFVEIAELEMIEAKSADQALELIKHQLRDLYRSGFEMGLHIHPWWYNARHEDRRWVLEQSEYNLCTLPKERIIHIVDRAITHLSRLLDIPDFTPVSFRAGHLLFQPTSTLASVIAERGIKVDSSLYKGGLWYKHHLDYRPALRNGYFWKFSDDVNIPDPQGALVELPIYTQMVPIWKMFTSKRIEIQQRSFSAGHAGKIMLRRLKDILRLRYPLKFDLCQMTMGEIIRIVDKIICEDHNNSTLYRPIVIIMHTKDPIDYKTVESFLSYLESRGIKISTFSDFVYRKR